MNQTKIPTFLVITGTDITIKSLQLRAKVIDYQLVRWCRYYNSQLITQCHRCQRCGHATTNCTSEHRCLKCSKNHETKNCTKTPDAHPTCANCRKAHTSNSTTCSVYQTIINRINKRNQQQPPKPTYRPAPQPQYNA